jgi:hypothetical protein
MFCQCGVVFGCCYVLPVFIYWYTWYGIPSVWKCVEVCGSVWKCVWKCVDVTEGRIYYVDVANFLLFYILIFFVFIGTYIYTYYSKISRIEISKQITLQITLFLTNYQIIHLSTHWETPPMLTKRGLATNTGIYIYTVANFDSIKSRFFSSRFP